MKLRFNVKTRTVQVSNEILLNCRVCKKKVSQGYYCGDMKSLIHRDCMICPRGMHNSDCKCGVEDTARHVRHISTRIREHQEWLVNKTEVKK